MFQLDLKSRKTIYEQIVDNLKELMIAEVLKPEDKLPSVRELSKTLTVNPNTIQKAYRELEYQGYVYTVTGLGTFVAAPNKAEINPVQLEEIITRIKTDIRELYFLGLSFEEIKKMILQLIEKRGENK
ncbi:MAG: GntR family transcriptional regulator [Clostridiales bacterium]|jgi:GntR family transcriptional regulator|uniref:GntR family transcriptional regulator n=1 Tax=Aminipila sp. TaxID=2060095 RepID=UPI001DB22030|nr:GntR family transcriptional regulator [Aminipila sp.]MBE6035475.1 GntR family transcriptional regulator [Clostridiales bacterium]